MTETQSALFAAPPTVKESLSVSPAPKPKKQCPRLKEPFGQPDAKGKYYYERAWAAWQTFDGRDRDLASELIGLPAERFVKVMAWLKAHDRAHEYERGDFDSAMGR
jgi:hypothetical protein